MLRTDENVQSVLLHRSLEGRDVQGVRGARVTVTGQDGRTVSFAEAGSECYTTPGGYFTERPGSVAATCYRSAPGEGTWVRPGGVYRLRVETPDGRVIQGRTRVPGEFSLVSLPFAAREAERAARRCAITPGRTLPVSWTRSDSAWSYIAPIRIYGLRAAFQRTGLEVNIPDPLELIGLAISEEDTTITLPTEFGIFDRFQYDNTALTALQAGFPEGVSVHLVVAAADRNYVNGVRGGSFNPSGRVRVSSVTGDGVGVFGSLVPLFVHIRVLSEASARGLGLEFCRPS